MRIITRKYLCWSLFLINLPAWIIESYWNSLLRLLGLILGITSKAMWNCIIAFLDPLNRKTSRIQPTLSTRKNWFALINWMDGKKSEAVVRRCSVKHVFLKISQNSQENTWEAGTFIKKKILVKLFSSEFSEISIKHLRWLLL